MAGKAGKAVSFCPFLADLQYQRIAGLLQAAFQQAVSLWDPADPRYSQSKEQQVTRHHPLQQRTDSHDA